MNAREYILDILKQVVYEDGYASLLLRKNRDNFSSEDNAFISETVYGTLRNYYYLEATWKEYAKTKVRSITALLLDMSIYHLFYLDKIPDYAVINEAVNLAKQSDKGFVNAVLHKVLDNGLKKVSDNTLEDIAIRTSHPLWILQMWKAHYGEDIAIKLAEYDQTKASVYGRINTLKTNKIELEKDEKAHFINDYSFTYEDNLARSSYFKNGEVVIQDYASSLIPLKMELTSGLRVLDACASPGTKTQEIAMLMQDDGYVEAHDIYAHRVELINELMERTNVHIVHAEEKDSSFLEEDKIGTFDRILVDAPCSGLGDLRHKPEIRFHLKPENIDALVALQKKILNTNAYYVKENGILVYSTCTLNKKENERQISSFLKEHEDFILEEEKTIFPFESNSDGFYYAKMKKKKEGD